MRNVSDKNCRENENTHFMANIPPPRENRAVYEMMWKNMVEPDRVQMIRCRKDRFESGITKVHTQNM
jgi:hypothetical protein